MNHLDTMRRRGRLAAGRNWSAVTADAVAFLDPIDQICEEPPPRFLRGTHMLVVGLFVSLLTVASVVRVDVVVVGSGRLVTDTPPIVVQPMERAIIRSLLVKPGDTVTRGQVLATLDPTFTGADLASLALQRRSLLAQLHRLQAEADGAVFSPAGPADADEALQATLSRQRQAEYQARLGGFDADIAKLQATIAATESNRAALGGQLDVARQVEAMRATLLQQRNGSKLLYLEALDTRLHAERDQQAAAEQLPELRHGVQSLLAERESFVDGWRREVSESLVAVRAELAKVSEDLAKAARLNELVVVTAAQDGVVLDVARLSAGSVLREAEPLLSMIPAGAPLIAEVMIGSKDVGDITQGSAVEVKVDAFPYQRHGILKGRLLSVGQESFSGGGMAGVEGAAPMSGGVGAFHRARVALLGTALRNLPPGARLFPGMTLTAEIKVGTRSAISYFISPLTRGLDESIREP